MKDRRQLITSGLLIIGITIVVNVLSSQFFLRLDLTREKQYSLSEATKNILKNLDEPVTVKAYFSEDLPPDIAKTRQDFRDLLIEYSNRSKGNVDYEFINPNEDQEVENEALQNGIQPVMINMREKDQVKQQKAFLGAIVQKGESKDIIPFIQPGSAMEYAVSTSIKKLSIREKPSIALIQGHGEAGLNRLRQVASGLNILYSFEPFTMDGSAIPDKFQTIAIVAPKDTIPPADLQQLEAFLQRGGNIFLAYDKVKGDLQTATGSTNYTGIEDWLRSKGVIIENSFVVDSRCGAVTVQQQLGPMLIPTNIQFPYLPLIQKFTDHPIVKGLEQVLMQFASPIQFVGDSSISYTPIAQTSKKSGSITPPLRFDIQKKWNDRDFPIPNQTVAAVIEGPLSGNAFSRMVIVSDGDFPQGGDRQNIQQDNANLMVNAIDWLSDDTGLIDLRTKGVSSRPIDELDDKKKGTLKYLNFFLPIFLVLLYGLIRAQIKSSKRRKRELESYV